MANLCTTAVLWGGFLFVAKGRGRFMDMEKEVSELREDVGELRYKVRDLEFWYKRLDDDVKDIKQTVGKFERKLDETRNDMLDIARDAGARVPKWVMWSFSSFAIPIVGWAVYVILSFHH